MFYIFGIRFHKTLLHSTLFLSNVYLVVVDDCDFEEIQLCI